MKQKVGGNSEELKPPLFGIYIHVPFCQRKCRYCDFFSEDTGLERIASWSTALATEIELRVEQGDNPVEVATIYIGGGSPNLLKPAQLAALVSKLREHTACSALAEFTIELNPNLLSEELIETMRAVGVNRISLGLQSLQANELRTLGRLHTVEDCYRVVANLRAHGFNNLSLDLIYGIPGQTLTSWQDSVRQALTLQPMHLSLYNLTYEPATPLANALAKGEIEPLEEDLEWQMYTWAETLLNEQGYEHYEISNWAKPGWRARHNQSYWELRPYLGFGPAAHSFNGSRRAWNVRSIDDYTRLLAEGRLPIEGEEVIDEPKRRLEVLLLSLRIAEGIAISTLEQLCGTNWSTLQRLLENKLRGRYTELLTIEADRLRLTPSGWFVYNSLLNLFSDLIKEQKYGHQSSV